MGKLLVQLHDRLKNIGDDLGKGVGVNKDQQDTVDSNGTPEGGNPPWKIWMRSSVFGGNEQIVTFSKLREVVTGPWAGKYSEMHWISEYPNTGEKQIQCVDFSAGNVTQAVTD